MKTSSNYNAFNQLANSHKVQLSIDVQNLLADETKNETAKPSCEESIAQWANLPVVQTTFEPIVSEDQTVQLPASYYQQARLEISSEETMDAMVQPLSSDLMSQWTQPLNQTNQTFTQQPAAEEPFKPGATQLRKLITKYKGLVYTQSLPVIDSAVEALAKRLRPIMIDRRQEQQGRLRWFGSYSERGIKAGCVPVNAQHLLENARLRWSA